MRLSALDGWHEGEIQKKNKSIPLDNYSGEHATTKKQI